MQTQYLCGMGDIGRRSFHIACAALFFACGPASAALSDGLIGYWKFDEASGNALDSAGGDNIGAFQGGAARVVGGKIGSAVDFDGINDFIDVSTAGMPRNSAAQTLAAWIKIPTANANAAGAGVLSLIGDGSSSSALVWGFGCCLGNMNAVRFGGGELVSDGTNFPISAGTWHHYAFTTDASTHRLYLDGQLMASGAGAANSAFPATVSIGAAAAFGASFFKGLIDEVRVYGRALSADEIGDLYFEGLFTASASSVVATSAGVTAVIPAGAFPSDGYLKVSTGIANAALQAASQKRLGADPFAQTVKTVRLRAFDGTSSTMSLVAPMSVTIPYLDADQDGFVDGTSPPVREAALGVYWLEETSQNWIKLPGARVDAAANSVVASVPHLSYFALIGSADGDLSAAYAYPVPYVPSKQTTRVITFAGLSSTAKIRIFTVSGRLVRTIEETDGDGRAIWNAKNESGEDAASGLYMYLIESGADKKSGELIIVR